MSSWLINPFTMGCPINGCPALHKKLNAFNRVEYMFDPTGHWRKVHAGNPAATRLIARFEFAKRYPHADAAAIDADATRQLTLTNEWALATGLTQAQGFDGFRPLSGIVDLPIVFRADLSTPLARGQYIAAAKEKAAALVDVETKLNKALDQQEV